MNLEIDNYTKLNVKINIKKPLKNILKRHMLIV